MIAVRIMTAMEVDQFALPERDHKSFIQECIALYDTKPNMAQGILIPPYSRNQIEDEEYGKVQLFDPLRDTELFCPIHVDEKLVGTSRWNHKFKEGKSRQSARILFDVAGNY